MIGLRIKLGVSGPGFLVDQGSLVRKGLRAFLKKVMDKDLRVGNHLGAVRNSEMNNSDRITECFAITNFHTLGATYD